MRRILFILLIIWNLGCSNDDVDIYRFHDDSEITTLNGTWQVISFEDFTANKIEYPTQENSWNMDIIVTFDDTQTPNELTGTNISNQIFGEFEYTGQRKFKLETLASTYVAQPDWADKFSEAILDDDIEFKINTSGLRIYYQNKTKSVTLVKN